MNEEIVIKPCDMPADVIKFINRFDDYSESMLPSIPELAKSYIFSSPLSSKDEAILFFLIWIVSQHTPYNFIAIELVCHRIFKLSIDFDRIARNKNLTVRLLKGYFKYRLSLAIVRRKCHF